MKRNKLAVLLMLVGCLLAGCGQDNLPAPTEQTIPTSYRLELTPEQTGAFESGKFYLMRRFGNDRFLPFYESHNVRLEGNTLVADFSGKVLYYVNDAGLCNLIETVEGQTVDGVTQYRTKLVFDEYTDENGIFVDYPTTYNIYVAYDRETEELVNSQILTDYSFEQVDLFRTAYTPLELPDARFCTYSGGDYYYLTRGEDGAVLPLDQWELSGGSWMEIDTGKGAALKYGDLATITAPLPLTQGEVVLVFEVTNRDETSWCAEPFAIPIREKAPAVAQNTSQPLQIHWSEGTGTQLLEKDGVTFILRKNTPPSTQGISYALEVKNDSQQSIQVALEDIVYNDRICGTSSLSLYAYAGQWRAEAFRFGPEAGQALQSPIQKLSFQLEIYDVSGLYPIWSQPIEVILSEQTAITPYWEAPMTAQDPYLEFLAKEDQLLAEENGIRFTLECMGDTDHSDRLSWLLKAENTAPEIRTAYFGGVVLNGVYFHSEHSVKLQPGQVYYYEQAIYPEKLEQNEIQAIYKAAFLLAGGTGNSTQLMSSMRQYPVEAAAAAESEGQQLQLPVLWEAAGLRIYKKAVSQEYGRTEWQLILENTTREHICLKVAGAYVSDPESGQAETVSTALSNNLATADSRVYATLSTSADDPVLYVRFRLLSADTNNILHTDTQAVCITPDA